MKIIAWNVNGIRALLKTNNLDNLIKRINPNILCLGEIKVGDDISNIDEEIKNKYPKFKYRYWHKCSIKQGYSGTSIFCKKEPISINYGLNKIDNEGRVITLEFKKYYLIHVYTPNSGQALERLEFRTKVWDRLFEKYINDLQKNKNVIVCGDLNVAKEEIDLKNPKTNLRTAGFTVEEKESFKKILNKCDLIDIYRYLYPEKTEYTFWSYMRKSRDKNIGWRIDYFLLNKNLINKVKKVKILTNILGSDHAPIYLKI